jgi:hypothetical protein
VRRLGDLAEAAGQAPDPAAKPAGDDQARRGAGDRSSWVNRWR